VIPLFPEAITHQDGATKNDCEANASKRLLKQLHEAFPNWPLTVVEDSLSATGPHIKLLKKLKFSFIISVKPDGQESLFAEVKNRILEGKSEEFEVVGADKIVRGYRWINGVPLNKSHPDLLVNFLDYWEIREGKEFNFSWITDIQLTAKIVHLVMKGGRSRWHIENQTFNTLKNQDYEFEHNYGHGEQYLATVFAMLMMLAFLIDQVQEYSCAFFQATRQRFRSRTSLWIKIKGLFTEFVIENWEALWRAIIYGHGGGFLQPNTS
jgi:transposase